MHVTTLDISSTAEIMIEDEASQERGEETSDREAPPAKDPITAQAEELVSHFYQLFYGTEKAYPSPKELGHAIDLITQHGFERARYIVDFSHRAAPETDYLKVARNFTDCLESLVE